MKKQQEHLRHLGSIGFSALCLLGALSSARAAETPEEAAARLEALKQKLADQTRDLEALKRSIAEQEAKLNEVRRALGLETLAAQRAAGTRPGGPEQVAQAQQQAPTPVGQAPEQQGRPPDVAQIFEQPGVLTPQGKFSLEPSIQYAYSSSNRVVLVGYTIIPALLIGLIDVREVKRNTLTGALTGRIGLTNRSELEVRVPYVYRSDDSVSREIFTGTSQDKAFQTTGKGIGDIELTGRYQLNEGGADKPFYVATLRFKTRTGKDPFDVTTDCSPRCIGPNVTGTGLPLEAPTGSGFYAIQPGLTWLLPADPAVFFGSVSYLHNFKRTNVSRKVIDGEEFLGTVEAGDIIGFNFGMGFAVNEKTSFSLGYDHNSVARTKQNGEVVPGSVRTQLGTLLLGFSFQISPKTSLNLSIGAGLTRDTPDVTLTARLPMSF